MCMAASYRSFKSLVHNLLLMCCNGYVNEGDLGSTDLIPAQCAH